MCSPGAVDYILGIFKPDAAGDNVGVPVFIDIAQSNTLSVRAINNSLSPLIVTFLAPDIDFIACFMAELGLVSRDNVRVSVSVQVAKLYIVGGMIRNFMGFPNILSRVVMRSRIFIPYQTSHDDI